MRLAIVVTHPIRYFVPLIQLLSKRGRITMKVFYTYGPGLLTTQKYNPENWNKSEPDIPIYEGYDYAFVFNAAKRKSTYSYNGIHNPSLIKEIEDWKPDSILVCGWKFKSHFKVMRYFKGKLPIHFRGDSTLLEEVNYGLPKKIFRRILLRWVYSYIDKAWYVGKKNREYFLAVGIKEKQLYFVPHTVDNERFRRTNKLSIRSRIIRDQLNIPGNAIVFLYAGKLTKEKGAFTLLEAFKKASSQHTHLIFVGEGKASSILKEECIDHSNIHFLAQQAQSAMPLIYSIADVLIQPSENDTWSLVINEAMANGLAIIASDQCGAAYDLVEDGHNGYMFYYKDADRLAEIIQRLSIDQEKLHSMKQFSLQKIDRYSYHVAAEAIESLLLKEF